MKTDQRYALALCLMESLYGEGSWCGETHVQKSMYVLEHLKGVPVDMHFTLYKHGPYSFDLHDILGDLRSLKFVENELRPPYGPRLRLTEQGKAFLKNNPVTEFLTPIKDVVQLLKDESVQGLEKLATALLLALKYPEEKPEDRATRLHKIKPHITESDALTATQKMDSIRSAA